MKRTIVQMHYSYDASSEGVTQGCCAAEVRTWNDRWTGDVKIDALSVGDHESSDDARRAVVKRLRQLADVIERDG